MECCTWYYIIILHYQNQKQALAILNNHDRGLFFVRPDNMNNPSEWTFTKTSWFNPRLISATEGNFVMPIPAIELSQAPNLQAPAVDYP